MISYRIEICMAKKQDNAKQFDHVSFRRQMAGLREKTNFQKYLENYIRIALINIHTNQTEQQKYRRFWVFFPYITFCLFAVFWEKV